MFTKYVAALLALTASAQAVGITITAPIAGAQLEANKPTTVTWLFEPNRPLFKTATPDTQISFILNDMRNGDNAGISVGEALCTAKLSEGKCTGAVGDVYDGPAYSLRAIIPGEDDIYTPKFAIKGKPLTGGAAPAPTAGAPAPTAGSPAPTAAPPAGGSPSAPAPASPAGSSPSATPAPAQGKGKNGAASLGASALLGLVPVAAAAIAFL
ncbi:hypothetical protein BC832DRAFT_565986 [Gaertneriomyces semiglobifer]|nr:hypothetical protein BC832DRAFT_565986 [Gaertneriomyces semiglobifer]